jgi:uroporphyrinogen decarboxylase
MIEGKPTKEFSRTKAMLHGEPELWHRLMSTLTEVTISYLLAQVEAGAQMIQLFDSWAGALSVSAYEQMVLPYSRRILETVGAMGVPTIHFGTTTSHLLEPMARCGSDVISVDWRLPLDEAWRRIGDRGIQGNLDPGVMLAPFAVIAREARQILASAGGRPGHIFNLGHGVLPETPSDNLKRLAELVHEDSARA